MSTEKFITFSRPFINASKTIFETMVYTKLETKTPSLKKDAVSKGDVSAVLGITGTYQKDNQIEDLKGMLVLSWPYETYINIANAMLMESYTEFGPEIADVGAEISNMIMGNAKRELREMGYMMEMTIPSTISGKSHSINYPPKTKTIIIPLNSAHGEFFMEICYNG